MFDVPPSSIQLNATRFAPCESGDRRRERDPARDVVTPGETRDEQVLGEGPGEILEDAGRGGI